MNEWLMLLFGLCFLYLARTFLQERLHWWSLMYSGASVVMLFGVVCDFSENHRRLCYGIMLLILLGGVVKLVQLSTAHAKMNDTPP